MFWEKTLHRPWPREVELVRAQPQVKLPVVLSASEVRRLLAAVTGLDHRVCLTTIYSCGLRLGEGLRLEVRDIDSERMLLHIRGGKGNRDRYVPLPERTLLLLREQWKSHRRPRLLLPTPYFLVTFTVPQEIRLFIRAHQQVTLDLFFAVTSQALQDLAANPRLLGARLGLLGVLHTWSRTLVYHPHIHYLVPGGGLSPDGRTWIAARPNFLLPVKALGAHVRTLFKERLQREHPDLFARVPAKVWRRHWNVDSRAAGSGENALRYLSRYLFKTATGNRLVERLPDGRVLWPYRDSKTGRPASLVLPALDWMSRFLQHILPPHFARVRTFGWLHPAAKVRANRVRALLGEQPLLSAAEHEAWHQPEEEPPPPAATAAPARPDVRNDARNELPTQAPAAGPPPCATPTCPRCQRALRLVGTFRAGRALRPFQLPNRPP
jgi:hypothetical protein